MIISQFLKEIRTNQQNGIDKLNQAINELQSLPNAMDFKDVISLLLEARFEFRKSEIQRLGESF